MCAMRHVSWDKKLGPHLLHVLLVSQSCCLDARCCKSLRMLWARRLCRFFDSFTQVGNCHPANKAINWDVFKTPLLPIKVRHEHIPCSSKTKHRSIRLFIPPCLWQQGGEDKYKPSPWWRSKRDRQRHNREETEEMRIGAGCSMWQIWNSGKDILISSAVIAVRTCLWRAREGRNATVWNVISKSQIAVVCPPPQDFMLIYHLSLEWRNDSESQRFLSLRFKFSATC